MGGKARPQLVVNVGRIATCVAGDPGSGGSMQVGRHGHKLLLKRVKRGFRLGERSQMSRDEAHEHDLINAKPDLQVGDPRLKRVEAAVSSGHKAFSARGCTAEVAEQSAVCAASDKFISNFIYPDNQILRYRVAAGYDGRYDFPNTFGLVPVSFSRLPKIAAGASCRASKDTDESASAATLSPGARASAFARRLLPADGAAIHARAAALLAGPSGPAAFPRLKRAGREFALPTGPCHNPQRRCGS